MRLIDADALIKQIEADAEQMEGPIAKMFTYASISDVKHAPTIEPERKTGQWIYKDDLKQFFCSECEYPSLTYDDTYIYGMDLPNYCENCGSYNGGKK